MNLDISSLEIVNISILENFLITTNANGIERKYDISNIEVLDCSKNKLSSLPTLPEGLKTLYCSGNQLTSLPTTLPEGLGTLYCGGNKLTFLPTLPEEIYNFFCYENPLIYIQYLKKRPFFIIVPSHLEEKYSVEVYERNYVLQTLSRYLIFFFMRRSKYYNTFRIFETILSESLL